MAWHIPAFTDLVKMVGFRKQLEAMIDHVKKLFFEPDISQIYGAGEVLRPRDRRMRRAPRSAAEPDRRADSER